MNRVTLCGNLGKDPELNRTQSGIAVTNFSVATTERRKEGEHTEWHNIVCWDKLAENCAKFLAKGRKVLIEGKLQTRAWEKDGIKRYTTEIVASTVEFLSPPVAAVAEEDLGLKRKELDKQLDKHLAEMAADTLADIPF